MAVATAIRLTQRRTAGALTIGSSLVLVALLGALDYETGTELSVSAFYLIPVLLAAWISGRAAGMWIAFACAVAWLVSELAGGMKYRQPLAPYWNDVTLFVFFIVVVQLVTAFHGARDHLEETVEQRTAALQAEISERKRLEIAKIQAERLAIVGRMAAEVAHEVRNPLGSIVLNLDLIQKEIAELAETSRHSPKEGDVLVNEMREEVQRIQNVLAEYLQFARLPKLQPRLIVLNELLDQKLAFLEGELAQAGMKLRASFDPAVTTVNADPEQLWRATLNLIRNGLEATSDGDEIIVSTLRDGRHACLRVTDTGTGMSEEQIQQAFLPFSSTKPAGTGLGLALVQQIVIEHGGYMKCESVPGKGSTFSLFLPLMENS